MNGYMTGEPLSSMEYLAFLLAMGVLALIFPKTRGMGVVMIVIFFVISFFADPDFQYAFGIK